jgi:hypothetical protein
VLLAGSFPTINGDDAHLPLMFRVFSLPLISFHVLEQSMVDSSPHTVYDEVTRNQMPFLQIHPWKLQRDYQYENECRELSIGVITCS